MYFKTDNCVKILTEVEGVLEFVENGELVTKDSFINKYVHINMDNQIELIYDGEDASIFLESQVFKIVQFLKKVTGIDRWLTTVIDQYDDNFFTLSNHIEQDIPGVFEVKE